VYIRHCLKGNLRRFKGKVLMQDGAAPHTGKLTKKFIADHRINVLPNWPPRSPDLNPIENLWAWLSRLVSDMGPTDEDELEQFVIEAWENLDQEEIDELVRTYQRRLEGCIANGGRTLNGLPPAPPKP
jgi:transposase